MVLKHRLASEAAQELVRLAQAQWRAGKANRGYRDDITCIVALLPLQPQHDGAAAAETSDPPTGMVQTYSI